MRYLQGFVYIQPDPPTNNPGMRINVIKTQKSKDDVLKDKSIIFECYNCCSKKISNIDWNKTTLKYFQIFHDLERLLFTFYFQINRN